MCEVRAESCRLGQYNNPMLALVTGPCCPPQISPEPLPLLEAFLHLPFPDAVQHRLPFTFCFLSILQSWFFQLALSLEIGGHWKVAAYMALSCKALHEFCTCLPRVYILG
jgi:hypothetical protein